MSEKKSVIIIDDEANFRNLLSRILSLEGYTVNSFKSANDGIEEIKRAFYSVAIIDVVLPDMNGVQLTKTIKEKSPDTEIIVMTAYATIPDGVEAMRNGAYDYIEKGKNDDEIIFKVNQATEKTALKSKVKQLQNKVEKNFSFSSITGKSKIISQAIELAKKVADTNSVVLLLGETGTGKELFAQAIHEASSRKNKPFLAINCSAIPKDLQESEFFGYLKGAFTGAIKDKKGYFEATNGGTIFLDEIGDMSIDTQSKLLRVLETNSFTKIGATDITNVDVRIISATNKDLKSEIEKGSFKNDLFYRLNTFSIHLPALRERKDDIELIIYNLVSNYNYKLGKHISASNKNFISVLKGYSFPGNIRQLKNIIERAIILCTGDELTPEDLPDEIFEVTSTDDIHETSLKEIEKQHILKIYSENNRNKTLTAEKLGVGSVTLYRKLKEYGVE